MARIVENSDEYETWKNSTRSKVILKRFDQKGNVVDEVIRGGRTFHITPVERRFNQEIAATDDLDVFQNGLLSPVKLIEGTEDVAQFATNPNHISESEMVALLKGKNFGGFEERVAQMSNVVTLNRMLELANTDEVNATVKHLRAIEARVKELSPELFREVETVDGRGLGSDGGARAVPLK